MRIVLDLRPETIAAIAAHVECFAPLRFDNTDSEGSEEAFAECAAELLFAPPWSRMISRP